MSVQGIFASGALMKNLRLRTIIAGHARALREVWILQSITEQGRAVASADSFWKFLQEFICVICVICGPSSSADRVRRTAVVWLLGARANQALRDLCGLGGFVDEVPAKTHLRHLRNLRTFPICGLRARVDDVLARKESAPFAQSADEIPSA